MFGKSISRPLCCLLIPLLESEVFEFRKECNSSIFSLLFLMGCVSQLRIIATSNSWNFILFPSQSFIGLVLIFKLLIIFSCCLYMLWGAQPILLHIAIWVYLLRDVTSLLIKLDPLFSFHFCCCDKHPEPKQQKVRKVLFQLTISDHSPSLREVKAGVQQKLEGRTDCCPTQHCLWPRNSLHSQWSTAGAMQQAG